MNPRTFRSGRMSTEKVLDGVLGAYSSELNTIYLDDSLLAPGQNGSLKDVLLEEMGHYFDTLLNPGEDTQGDEGELFRNVVKGNTLSESELDGILADDDSGWITVNQTPVFVEQYEVFTLINRTNNVTVYYTLDGSSAPRLRSGNRTTWTAYSGGIIRFDADARSGVTSWKSYNLANGINYYFRPNNYTSNRSDFDLYSS